MSPAALELVAILHAMALMLQVIAIGVVLIAAMLMTIMILVYRER